ncbi:MAG: glycosyltransferase [Rhodocyclaceae bacterium]|nr:glycosyltransferase [Rhodocyclaceae bacterium]
MARILLVHQNFPGQFKHLAPTLVRQGHEVVATTLHKSPPATWNGVRMVPYAIERGSTRGIHAWVSDFETKVIRGEAFFRKALELRAKGYQPDLVIAHHGWGETLFVKDVWPQARLAIYCEFYYKQEGADSGFDPEFPSRDIGDVCRLRLKNLNNLLHFNQADAGISPTEWQASTFPEPFRSRISVIHDGIDTLGVCPDPAASVRLPAHGIAMPGVEAPARQLSLSREDEVITFVNRNLEPYRGYHTFMRALPALLKARPRAQVVIVGGDDVSYGARPREGKWKDIFVNEVRERMTAQQRERVHFVGHLAYPGFVSLLQVSTVHVYLTYPFVLSWSLLESMSAGCAIVASDTAPLREAILEGETGRLVDFFDAPALAQRVADLCADPAQRQRLGAAARAFAEKHYDLHTVCLPRQVAWVKSLLAGGA